MVTILSCSYSSCGYSSTRNLEGNNLQCKSICFCATNWLQLAGLQCQFHKPFFFFLPDVMFKPKEIIIIKQVIQPWVSTLLLRCQRNAREIRGPSPGTDALERRCSSPGLQSDNRNKNSSGNAGVPQWLMAAVGAPASLGREMQCQGQPEALAG